MSQFENDLQDLQRVLCQSQARKIIMAGDFNAKSRGWGSSLNDARGEALSEMIAAAGLIPLNAGRIPTFTRSGAASVLDVTFVSDEAARLARGWRVMQNEESMSDHSFIAFEMDQYLPRVTPQTATKRWFFRRSEAIEECLDRAVQGKENISKADELCEILTKVCDESLVQQKSGNRRKPMYWWNQEIADLRKECIRTRRLLTRMRHREGALAYSSSLHDELKQKKKVVKECHFTKQKEMLENFMR